MRIGELAARTGVSARSLRYYEEQGLLSPARTPSGQRVYDDADARAVAAVRELFDAGFCSSVIACLLPAVLRPDAPADDLARAFAAARARLADEKAAVQREIDALEELGSRLGLAPDAGVRVEHGVHDSRPEAAPPDHRDRRLR